MATTLAEILDLEVVDTDLYRGSCPATARVRTFGGQVAGQALVAAGRTVDADRHVHSLHAYFLRPGDTRQPIVYHVDRIRDGGSFTTRRVVATQRGEPIFHLSASFQVLEEGLEHTTRMPSGVPGPDEAEVVSRDVGDDHPDLATVEVRVVPTPDAGGGEPTRRRVWFRPAAPLPDDPLVHVCAVAFASDLTLLGATLLPHAADHTDVQMASLDHAMWFHRPFRLDDWMLYGSLSPSASGGRGLAYGQIWTRDGDLVASVVQEGLIRPRDPSRT